MCIRYRKIIIVSLIFLFLINSFASKVSDNDGSAFITKNEFDSLKSSFQSRIDEYNRNIDNKIDVAIASYLKGIILSNEYGTFDKDGDSCLFMDMDECHDLGLVKYDFLCLNNVKIKLCKGLKHDILLHFRSYI